MLRAAGFTDPRESKTRSPMLARVLTARLAGGPDHL
jgi:hypothetical protein